MRMLRPLWTTISAISTKSGTAVSEKFSMLPQLIRPMALKLPGPNCM